ncbi:MAG: two-component regulator propeller domain-containing protein, partial [Bacteroidota bacterium]
MTYHSYLLILLCSILTNACSTREQQAINSKNSNNTIEPTKAPQIGQYVTDTYEDSNGHLWFGTIQYGIARYDGNELVYFTQKNGLPSNRVTSVQED